MQSEFQENIIQWERSYVGNKNDWKYTCDLLRNKLNWEKIYAYIVIRQILPLKVSYLKALGGKS